MNGEGKQLELVIKDGELAVEQQRLPEDILGRIGDLIAQQIEEAVKELMALTPVSTEDVRPDNLSEKREALLATGFDITLYQQPNLGVQCWVFLHQADDNGSWQVVKGFLIACDIWTDYQVKRSVADWPDDWEPGWGVGVPNG